MSAVIFDLDGVLVESEPYWRQGLADVLNEWTRRSGPMSSALTSDDLRAYEGGRVSDTLTRVLVAGGHRGASDPAVVASLTEQVVRQVSALFEARPAPIEASVAVARALHSRGVRLGVASSSAPEFIAAALRIVGLSDAVSVTQSALHLERGKPDPEVYLRCAERLGEPPERCVAIEDSQVGVSAAAAAGIPCIGLWRGAGPAPGYFRDCAMVSTALTEADVDAVLRQHRSHGGRMQAGDTDG